MMRLQDGLAEERLTGRDKGIPQRAVGMTTDEFLATGPSVREFWTPLVVLDDAGIGHNCDTMAEWCRQRGLEIMPHGKTTMAPKLWRRQLDAGAAGITLATMGQVRTGRAFGLESIMLANAVVDERSLRWLAHELADPGLAFVCWADSVATVEQMDRVLRTAGAARPVDVCVELGADGGRTGARTVAEAVAVAERVASAPTLRLAGVAGYEGCLGHDRSGEALRRVRDYLERQLELHDAIRNLYGDGDRYVTAGGSAYLDVVADVYGAAAADSEHEGGRTRFVVRAGAYIVHDDGFYRGISPFDEARPAGDWPRLWCAMHGLARVVSHPEPGLALLDGGKRDFPYDEGLPIPRWVAADLGADRLPLRDARIDAMNDQHSYLRLGAEDAAAGVAPIGAVVGLGLSHPCTTFDKWRLLPVVESAGSDVVVDLIRTYF